jgi:ATP-binding cassette subfamily B protein
VNNGLNTVVLNTMMMAVATGMLLYSDWRIALAVLWLGPVLYFMNLFYRKRIGAKWRIVREHFTRISTNLAENINGMRVVTAYNRQDENLTQFNQLQDLNTLHNVGAAVINGMYQPLLNIVGYLGQVIILIFGAYLALRATGTGEHSFTVGTLIALMSYWQWFMNPVLNFGTFHNEMMMSMASAERVFALLEQQPDVTDAADAMELPPIQGRVTFEHVHFHYVKDKPVLHDIDFEAKPGQTIALVGHTGCGKSTIMNLICRFYVPQAGRILLDGHDLTKVTSESLHRQMGIVAQANYLFSGTVLDNIRYAAPEATEEQVTAAAKELGSHDILTSLKDGYHTQVGERGASMSLGQRQLICFTRAFLANPRILMLDEATSAVDTHTEMVIQEALERLVADRTTFIVAHRLSTVTRADLVLVLDQGRVIERGTHGELLTLGGKYAELYKQFTREIE